MKLPLSAAIALTAALGAMAAGNGVAAAPKPSSRPPVKLTFADNVPDGPTYNITSDGAGVYQDGVGGVMAYIDRTSGHLNFATSSGNNTSGRELQFGFTCLANCLAGEPLPVGAPYASGFAQATLLSGVRDASGNTLPGGLLSMEVNGPQLRAGIHLNIPLDSDPAFWTICMNAGPLEGGNFCAFSQYSTTAHVVRSATGTWTISATDTDVAELMNDGGSQKRTRLVDYLGTYSMPFSITVECLTSNCS